MFQLFPPKHPNPIIGHVASRDMVRWAHLPVALANTTWYDRVAVWTGSATVVDGVPYLVYPGRCEPGDDGCGETGFDYNQAIPEDLSDPLYTNWKKLPSNPIINSTFDDPSTAWRTSYGEWRFIGNSRINKTTSTESPIFATSNNFRGPWRRVGLVEGLAWGECPSLYPLPALAPGTRADRSKIQPTHVFKRSRQTHNCSGDCSGDMVQLGTWTDGVPTHVGTWAPTPGVSFESTVIDQGNRYASKDFLDVPKNRRINWGWAHIEGGGQTIPRVQTYHPQLQRLIHSPLPELNQLHLMVLAKLDSVKIQPNVPMRIFGNNSSGSTSEVGRGNTSDLQVHFGLPDYGGFFGVRVMQTSEGEGGVLAYINLTAKGSDPGQKRHGSVGFLPAAVGSNAKHDTLELLPSDNTLSLQVFTDRLLCEAYWQNGQVAMTLDLSSIDDGQPASLIRGAMSIESSVEVDVLSANAFEMGSIWVDQELL